MVTAHSTHQERFFFEHYGLTNHDLETYLAAALSAGGDYADLYFEYLTSTSLMVDESLVKSASQGISAGCGVRVVSGERTGYGNLVEINHGDGYVTRYAHNERTLVKVGETVKGGLR